MATSVVRGRMAIAGDRAGVLLAVELRDHSQDLARPARLGIRVAIDRGASIAASSGGYDCRARCDGHRGDRLHLGTGGGSQLGGMFTAVFIGLAASGGIVWPSG